MKHLAYILASIIFFSCSIDLEESDPNVPVIESYILPGNEVTVYLKRQLVFNSNDTIDENLNDVNISLSINNESYILEESSNGVYQLKDIEVNANDSILLAFNYNGRNVSSQTKIPSRPEAFASSAAQIEAFTFSGGFGGGSIPSRPEPITLSWSNPFNEYHMAVVENIEENPELINTSTDRPARTFRNSPIQGEAQELNPMSFSYYGKHQIILFKLNAEYAALYEEMGTSSLDITAPPSNIYNGLGIFTGINSDTLFIDVVEAQ